MQDEVRGDVRKRKKQWKQKAGSRFAASLPTTKTLGRGVLIS